VIELLHTWGALFLSVLALAQPWVITLWRKYFRQGTVDIFPSGQIMVGYSAFGPVLTLSGTLRGLFRDLFVRSIDLTVTRQRDGAKHTFRWTLFREGAVIIASPQQTRTELASGFMVTTGQPYRYAIDFFDLDTQNDVRKQTVVIQLAWNRFTMADAPTVDEDFEKYLNRKFFEFIRWFEYTNAIDELRRLCYWDSGRYTLTMRIKTSRPDRSFCRSWSFELSTEEAESIRQNAGKIASDACGRSWGQYNAAYAEYSDTE